MNELAKQLTSLLGTGFAAACCLGVTAALSVLTAVGAGFLINDAILIPLYVALLALSLWLLYRTAAAHHNLRPFWLGVAGAVAAFAGLWVSAAVVYVGIGALVAGSLLDFFAARRRSSS
jgi:mercuric ion transport protein